MAVAITKLSRLYCFLLILVSKKKLKGSKFLPVKGERKRGNRRKIEKIVREPEIIRLHSALVTG